MKTARLLLVSFLLALFLLPAISTAAAGQTALVMTMNGTISPATEEYLKRGGTLAVAGDCGTKDEDNVPRTIPALTLWKRAGRVIECLVEVSLDGDPARGGAVAGEVPALAEALAAEEGLVLGGVMAVAPLSMPPADAFARLRVSAAAVREVRPGATVISAGMSGDLEAAVEAGATHLRIGTALLGDRGPRVG